MKIETSSSMSSRFPKLVGYRFHPTDEELISYYLKGKNFGLDHEVSNIPVIEVLKYDPCQLPRVLEQLGTDSGDDEWYFFCKRDVRAVRRGKGSSRSNRATRSGFWKPTGKDRNIRSKRDKKLIGTKKTLVFYSGNSKDSKRTTWVMHEYRSNSDNSQAFVLYLLKDKSEKTGDVSIPLEVEPGPASASPVTSTSDAMSPNPAIPVMNVEPGNHPTASHFEPEGSFLDDYEMQQYLESFGQFTAENLDEILPPMPQPHMIQNHGPSYTEIRYLNASTGHCADTLYQYGSNEPDESISVLSADIPENSDTDDEVTQSLLFESSTTFSSKSVTPQYSSYKETVLTKEIVGFETESSSDEDPGSEIVKPEAGKKLYLQASPQGTSRTRTSTSTSKGFFMLVENPRLKDSPSSPFVYVANILTATVLLIALVSEVLF